MRNYVYYFIFPLAALSAMPLDRTWAAILFLLIGAVLLYAEVSHTVEVPGSAFIILPYVLGFPLVVLLPNLYWKLWTKIPVYTIDQSMLWATRGFAMFCVGYTVVCLSRNRSSSPPARVEPAQTKDIDYTRFFITVIGLLAFVGWFVLATKFGISLVFVESGSITIGSASSTYLQILTLLAGLRYAYFLAFLVLRYHGQTNRTHWVLFLVLITISLLEIIVIGSKESIIRLLVIVVLAMAILPSQMSFKHMIIFGLVLINIYGAFAVITEYRAIILDRQQRGYNVFNYSLQLDSFKKAVIASLPFSEGYRSRTSHISEQEILGRFGSGMMSFANLLRVTGMNPPFENAKESFLVPLYSIVPRFLMPDKPVFFNSARNAQDYYGWMYGGISVSTIGSFYFAWGYWGILGGMLGLGLIFGAIVHHTRSKGLHSPHGIILLVSFTLPLMDVGVTFQSVITDCIRVTTLLFCIQATYNLIPKAAPQAGWTQMM